MQNKPSKNQHRNVYYRLRRSDPHERLSARLRRFSFGAAVFFVMAAAGIVTYSLYKIQIEQGATFRQYAAEQQLLDSTIQATRSMDHLGRPQLFHGPLHQPDRRGNGRSPQDGGRDDAG